MIVSEKPLTAKKLCIFSRQLTINFSYHYYIFRDFNKIVQRFNVMFFITGDTHGSYSRIVEYYLQNNLSKQDTIIILGDTGLNYYGDERDIKKKRKVSAKLPLTLFFIHGNHDIRPANIPSYREINWNGGIVYQENEFPNFLFAKDASIFTFDEKKTLAIGGAYSIDKHYRLENGYNWFEDEQPSPEIRHQTEIALQQNDWRIDTVLSHTCPLKDEPREAFFSTVNQSTVDKSTEEWLDTIDDRLTYNRWFCGHFHVDKTKGKLRFLFKDIIPF